MLNMLTSTVSLHRNERHTLAYMIIIILMLIILFDIRIYIGT